jgi:trehalose utilization protein
MAINVLIWNEYLHEKEGPVKEVYPEGIHGALKQELSADSEFNISTATLEMENHGLSEEILQNTDVLIWWGHMGHAMVSEEVADMVAKHVRLGMGLIVLHSGHHSKPFRKLMGTTCNLSWREIGENERVWIIDPNHPICQGLGRCIEIPKEEMYSEVFDIPTPDELIMIGWYKGGEVFRSGCVFKRGNGKIFYFQPGHEDFPTYHIPDVVTVIRNAVHYLKPVIHMADPGPGFMASPCVDPAEPGVLELYGVEEKPSAKFARMAEGMKERAKQMADSGVKW